jgi:Sulfotransferase family
MFITNGVQGRSHYSRTVVTSGLSERCYRPWKTPGRFNPDEIAASSRYGLRVTEPEVRTLTPVLVRLLEGRVGSTTMMQLLATSSAVALDKVYPFQNSYLSYFGRLAAQISRPSLPGRNILDFIYQGDDESIEPLPFAPGIIEPVEFAQRSLSAIWLEFSRSVAERASEDVRFYAEKYWGDIHQVIDAGLCPIVIDLVRDPRDVIVSMRAFNARHGERLFGRPYSKDEGEHFRRRVLAMALRFRQLREPLPVPGLRLRYEDFVSDMEGQAAKIESLLDIDLDVVAVTSNYELMERHMTAASVEGSIGRWRKELTSSEVSYIERTLGGFMRELGYP